MKKTYEVWALAYDSDWNITDFEQLLGTYKDSGEAIKFASNLNPNEVICTDEFNEGDIVHIQVETVVDKGEYTENIDTIYEVDYEFVGGKLI